ncbi:MAG: DUF2971 domain-containing protein [candidate division Zixibacteria bacterium]|nr:DUF2971 domain-containing protein [candidate division Zixibacteria bacterium]
MILHKYCDASGIDILKKLRLKVTPPSYLNDPMEWSWHARDSIDMDEWREIQRHHYFLKSFDADIGLICFSEVPDSTLMWSYYSASHTGLVFGFDTEKLPAAIQECLVPVSYSRKKVEWDGSDEATDGIQTTKSQEWSHEKEWRAIVTLDRCKKVTVGIRRQVRHIVPIPADSIVRVILGSRAPHSLFRKLLWPGLKLNNRVAFERAVIAPDEYRILIKETLDPRPESIFKRFRDG